MQRCAVLLKHFVNRRNKDLMWQGIDVTESQGQGLRQNTTDGLYSNPESNSTTSRGYRTNGN